MKRRHWQQFAAVLAVGILLRVLAYRWVGVWLDHGFYAYDSRLILEGERPFVDFLGRSPLWLYLYAGVRSVVGYSVLSLRAFIQFWWLVAALPVYGLAREIGDHGTGLGAAVVYWWLPYGVVYGMWANTMSVAAAFGVTAIYLAVAREGWRWWLLVGALVGAAFLARRSAIVLLPALTLFVLLRDTRPGWSVGGRSARLGALTAAWIVTLLVGYAAVVGGDPARTVALAETHAVNLLVTTGRGGWPLLGATVPNPGNTVQSGRIPILNDVCQLCGAWTARTIAKGLLASAPAAAIAVGGTLRYTTQRWFDPRGVPYLLGPLAVLALFAGGLAAWTGYWLRVVTIATLVAGALVAYRSELPTPRLRSQSALLGTLLATSGIIGGYLYRERVLHVYYGMDLWPYAAVLIGVLGVVIWRRVDRPRRVALVAVVVVASISSAGAAYPLANIVGGNDAGWYTTETLPEMQDAVTDRTDDGDIVLTKSATPLGGTGAQMPLDDSRSVGHFYSVFQDSGPMRETYATLSDGMADGRVALVIETSFIERIIADNATVARLYESHYCRVDDAETQAVFASANSTLYEYQSDCPTARRPTVNASLA